MLLPVTPEGRSIAPDAPPALRELDATRTPKEIAPMPRPALTRHDFETIAATLADCLAATLAAVQTAPSRELAGAQVRQYHASAARDIAAVLARSNGRFDSERFTAQAHPSHV